MADMEKVIKGLEVVRNAIVDGYIHEPNRAVNAITDALSMLKEQKAETEKLIGFINGFSKDAVPVVRCKDCKKRYTVHCIQEEVGNINNQDGWYCADGERR